MNITSTELNPQNLEEARHKDWLNHPTTQLMFKILEIRKQHTVKKMADNSYNFDINEGAFRVYGAECLFIETISNLLKDTNKFLSILTPSKIIIPSQQD